MSRALLFLLLLQSAPALSQSAQLYARVGDVRITVAQVQAAVDAAGASTRAEVQAIADELVDHELLLREARSRGLERSILVRDSWRTLMVQRFMRQEFDARLTRASITMEAIRARFDEDPSARGFEASAEGIRGALWRERRDLAVDRLLNVCRERSPVDFHPELLAVIPMPEEAPPREQFLSRFGCAHCARQMQNDPDTPTTVFGSPVPQVPAWARRGANMGERALEPALEAVP
ncbi:MAG: hypothetical protein AB8H86_28130 [Polyangiales bacterium]